VARFEGETTWTDLALGTVRADTLTAFGIHAPAAMANAEAHSQTEKCSETLENRLQELSAVMHVTDAISPSLTLDETLGALSRAGLPWLCTQTCA